MIPLISKYPPTGPVGVYAPQSRPVMGQREVRFGYWEDTVAKVFQPITEQFVYGFMAQDVIALWIPRVINALRRGRNHYDPQEDPKIRNKHPLQQLLHTWYMNIKGLNYPNAAEECGREFETGPMVLLAPSVIGAAASLIAGGKLAIMMPKHDLEHFKNVYKSVIANGSISALPQDADALSEAMHVHFLRHLISDHHFKAGLKEKIVAGVFHSSLDSDEALISFLKSLPQKHPTYENALEAWYQQWSKMPVKKGLLRWMGIKENQHIEAQKHIFNRLLHWYNDSVLKIKDPIALAQVNLAGEKSMEAQTLMENLRKFKPFILDAGQKALKTNTGHSILSLRPVMIRSVEQLYRNALVNKFLWLTVASTAVAGFIVVAVSAAAQAASKTYPANRNVRYRTIAIKSDVPHTKEEIETLLSHKAAQQNSLNTAYSKPLTPLHQYRQAQTAWPAGFSFAPGIAYNPWINAYGQPQQPYQNWGGTP